MSYTPTNWQNGDVITAEKLNHMEDGIASSSASYDLVLTETFAENNDPTMTGIGLSFEEIIEKIVNGDDVLIKYIAHNTDSGSHFSCYGISCYYEHDSSLNTDNITVVGAQNASGLSNIMVYFTDGEIEIVAMCDINNYTFTYDSTTQTYTFAYFPYEGD